MNIALFDFDGTITHEDMYTKFLFFSATKSRTLVAAIVLAPFYLCYKAGVIPASTMRTMASFVAFYGRKVNDVAAFGEEYAQQIVPNFLREVALSRLHWHINNGDQIVIVSASINVYLKPWCAQHGFALICSELEQKPSGRFSGRYVHGDCSGATKSTLVKSTFELESFDRIFAYGDTVEDLPMLSLADEAYFNWEQQSV